MRQGILSLLAAVLSTALALLAAEALARYLRPDVRFDLMAVDDVETKIVDGVELWRGKTPRYEPGDISRAAAAPDAFTILGLGDSIMYGVSIPKEQTYLEHTRRALARRGRSTVEILNLAVPGYNTMQENAVYKEIENQIQPNLVVLHYWHNDVHQFRFVGGYVVNVGDLSEDGHLVVRAFPLPARFNDFLLVRSSLYSLASRVVADWWISKEPDWTHVTEPLTEIHERVRRAGGRLVVLASPALDGSTAIPTAELSRLQEFASTRGIEVIDLSQWLHGIDVRSIALDDCHFNATGHQLIGERFAEYLLQRDLKGNN